jgi:hypothetical protein
MTSFPERLQAIVRQAEQEPASAWQAAQALVPEVGTALDAVHLGAVAAQLAGAALGHFRDGARFVTTLRQLSVVTAAPDALRSLWRAEAVLRHCAGDDEREALSHGISGPADRCRYVGLLAQTLAARGRLAEALAPAQETAALADSLPLTDPVVAQTALVAQNLARMASEHARHAHDLALAAASASAASDGRAGEWQRQHLALFTRMRTLLLAGRPGEALRGMHQLMDLEDRHQAGPFERFHTAALACRAYHARGDQPQAARTLEACRDFARRATNHDLSGELAGLERILAD